MIMSYRAISRIKWLVLIIKIRDEQVVVAFKRSEVLLPHIVNIYVKI
jgi:hypothetical protein